MRGLRLSERSHQPEDGQQWNVAPVFLRKRKDVNKAPGSQGKVVNLHNK